MIPGSSPPVNTMCIVDCLRQLFAEKPSARPPMRERSVLCSSPSGLHRMAYTEWGDPLNPRVLVCVHGLTRNGRDFDFLAQALASHYRVICPDLPGRGRSDRLAAAAEYVPPTYAADLVTLIARLDVESVDWVGTSLGGLVGMILASQPRSPIRRLVLNDVGPEISAASLRRIGQYLGKSGPFESVEAGAACLRALAPGFGPHTDAQWLALSRPMLRARPEGDWRLHYDPAIAVPYAAVTPESSAQGEALLWQLYDRVKADTLLLRGAESDLLTHETCLEMGRRGPKATVAEIPGVGHAPMFLDEAQVAVVREFLLAR